MLMICSFFWFCCSSLCVCMDFFFVVECFIRTINQTINKKIVDEIAGAHCKNIKQNIYDRGSIHLLTRSLSLCFALLLFFQHLMVVFILIFKYYHIQISSNKKARTKQKERIYYWGCGLLSGVFNVENSPVWSLDKIIYIYSFIWKMCWWAKCRWKDHFNFQTTHKVINRELCLNLLFFWSFIRDMFSIFQLK